MTSPLPPAPPPSRLHYSRPAPGADPASPPPDEAARRRIRDDLGATLLIEAGAGSGKTTSLVDRMGALVMSGRCKVHQIAAVTFTRMAAAELRQRFQLHLESRLTDDGLPRQVRERVEEAIQEIDGAFLGTIHSFCAKLLRERPLEADLDPGFREVQETEAARSQRLFWIDHLERLAADEDPQLAELDRVGIAPDRLQHAYNELVEHPDVDFLSEPVAVPDAEEVRAVRARLDALLDHAQAIMPKREPEDGWDPAAKRIRTLLYWRRAFDWSDPRVLFDALIRIRAKKTTPVQKRWAKTRQGKLRAKQLGLDITAFAKEGSRADRLIRQWWAYRYPVALGVAKGAADAYADERRKRGELTFQDLLVLAADLLRNNPRARRDLGERYRYILVDEFQDTDPLQAEILLLLASDPGANGHDWRTVVPRPGALFVVGDPKQSIYRFRRADITLYEFVKQRFRAFGEVLGLEANFRSLPEFGHLVRGVFDRDDRFPRFDRDRLVHRAARVEGMIDLAEEMEARRRSIQAAFAPLQTQKTGRGLIAVYPAKGKKRGDLVRDDAERIASEIARRVHSGERLPDDFMILTRTRAYLAIYARALEDRNLPFEVSGAGVGFEVELAAFLLLFRCLADPEHEVRVLGILTGPFFGITLDRIVRYRDGGGRFVIDRKPKGDCTVADAMRMLHRWWERARRESADVTAERLVDEIGLFPLAAAETLGALRAGALTYLLDAVRSRALAGDASLAGAVDAMQTALDWEDAEAPLVPGRPNCVRLMNLHRAKGLEAEVVFLAAPIAMKDWPAEKHVSREGGGVARGALPIADKGRFGRTEVIAQPLNWDELAAREKEFEAAEMVRLLYVAATRAKHELWIASPRGLPGKKRSPWEELEEWVRGEAVREEKCNATVLAELTRDEPPEVAAFEADAELAAAVAAARSALKGGRVESYRLETVTARVKGEGEPGAAAVVEAAVVEGGPGRAGGQGRPDDRGPGHRRSGDERDPRGEEFEAALGRPVSGGVEWGNVVHEVMAAAEGMGGTALRNLARDLLVERGREIDAAGEPTELDTLLGLVAAVRTSALWRRAMASPERYTEVPFALAERPAAPPLQSPSSPTGSPVPAEGRQGAQPIPQVLEAPSPTGLAGVPTHQGAQPIPQVLEGVIDLVFREDEGWVIADYKTDSGHDPHFGARVAQYRRQVDLYARCWEELTGEPVRERVLVFTAQGRLEAW